MFLSFFILLLITFSGLALTYLYDKDAPLLVRFGAGNVIGSALFSLVVFLAACAFGFSVGTILFSIAAALAPLFLLARSNFREKFSADRVRAFKSLENANLRKFANFAFYAGLLAAMCFFFERAMLVIKGGIYTGAAHNLGDLPFHLGAIFSFTEGNNFPPENPSYAFAKFTYPFMSDIVSAALVKLGARVDDAMFVQNVLLIFSLIILLERFANKLIANKLAGKLAPILLLFCGGAGFMLFLRDALADERGLIEFLWNLEADYTIRPEGLRWGNSLIVLFITQRSLLFGLPLALIVLTKLWEFFSDETTEKFETDNASKDFFRFLRQCGGLIFVGLLAGTLPLIHVHSLAVLFVVCAVLFFFRLEKWKEWIAFGAAVSIIAVPELVWSLTGSASRLSEFISWHFGWHKGDENFFVFWAKNLGIFIPMLLFALFFICKRGKNAEKTPNEETAEKQKTKIEDRKSETEKSLLIFYIPFVLCFVLPNFIKLAPWEWDNIKVLIYWFVGSVPFVAWLLARMWQRSGAGLKFVAVLCFVALTFSGALDVWRTISRQIEYQVFSPDSVRIAEQIKEKTPSGALFLNAPTYNSAVVLTGRRSFMRFTGHLSSYGIDYSEREAEVRRIYEGSALADSLLKKYGIEYVIVSPEERANLQNLNEAYFEKFPKIAEVGEYKVYKIK
jgi:hypothetical protein